jgi:hypothetical protein
VVRSKTPSALKNVTSVSARGRTGESVVMTCDAPRMGASHRSYGHLDATKRGNRLDFVECRLRYRHVRKCGGRGTYPQLRVGDTKTSSTVDTSEFSASTNVVCHCQ